MDKDYSFQRVYQTLNISANIKSQPEDFIVEENIDIDFSGDGEHCWLYIKKRECNTDWVAQQLTKYCQVKKLAVSYAGLKDRHAVTSQWFSVQLPGKPTPDWAAFEAFFSANASAAGSNENIQVLKSFRHNRKLQRGALKSNTFKVTLRQLSDASEEMFASLIKRCAKITNKGVPNYFGSQRFGRGFNNLDQAEKFFLAPRRKIAKHKRSLYLSAARSWMFNRILSERIEQNVWDTKLAGDVFMLDKKSACFVDDASAEIDQRLARKEIHPTAILWGEGDAMVTSQAAELESEIINQFPIYRDGLIAARLQSQRRACRVIPMNLECSRLKDDFIVSFTLPPGCYATMVLAEIFSNLQESHTNPPV
ncbi:tRNA pseudouridine(13) synthase [hydrothermal vent metagenome]|uniref:tRNA pseudouridine(13) synthase n=1 Tax=hydrothermal vent metagenome TaxID=652676 RepID=A0A3B0W7J0_9ZZZZ